MAGEFDFPHTTHIRDITLAGRTHNNKMERINGEVRDREKTMRGLKRPDMPILKGYSVVPQLHQTARRPRRAGTRIVGEKK
jgi:hypothetical protein